MTTEVQIGRNRLHLQLLNKVVSRTASWLGINRRDTKDIEDAVNQACLIAMGESSDDTNTPLNVKVSADSLAVTVDITNSRAGYLPLRMAEATDDGSGAMAKIGSLVDGVEFLAGEDYTTIRITKLTRGAVSAPAVVAGAHLGAGLQS